MGIDQSKIQFVLYYSHLFNTSTAGLKVLKCKPDCYQPRVSHIQSSQVYFNLLAIKKANKRTEQTHKHAWRKNLPERMKLAPTDLQDSVHVV